MAEITTSSGTPGQVTGPTVVKVATPAVPTTAAQAATVLKGAPVPPAAPAEPVAAPKAVSAPAAKVVAPAPPVPKPPTPGTVKRNPGKIPDSWHGLRTFKGLKADVIAQVEGSKFPAEDKVWLVAKLNQCTSQAVMLDFSLVAESADDVAGHFHIKKVF